MAPASANHAVRVVEYLQQNKPQSGDVSLNDVMLLAEAMTDSYKDFFEQLDKTVYRDLTAIANEITNMKTEIGRLRVDDMKNGRIPDAGRELDAIVEATEDATHTIMAAAEAIMGADPGDGEAYQNLVNDRVVEIFEACAFQDITGQRISKVVSALSYIEDRVSTFAERLKLTDADDVEIEESEDERRKRELILHGPQHDGEGVGQDDIDALLADDSVGSTQSDIDKLFG